MSKRKPEIDFYLICFYGLCWNEKNCNMGAGVIITYLSNEIATNVNTDVATVTFPIKLFTEQ